MHFDAKHPLSKYASHAIEEYPTANGPADYALVVDGQLLAEHLTTVQLKTDMCPRVPIALG